MMMMMMIRMCCEHWELCPVNNGHRSPPLLRSDLPGSADQVAVLALVQLLHHAVQYCGMG
jgi:hypothetical protein